MKDTEKNKEQLIAELAESEEKYRIQVEMASDCIQIETVEGRVLECNTAGAKMFGYTKEEIVGLTITDLVPEEFAKTLPKIITEKDTTYGKFVPRISKKKDGTIFPTEIATKLINIGNKPRLIAYIRDITERKRVEKKRKSLLKKEREQHLKAETLAKVALILTSKLSLSDVLEEVLRQVKRLVPYSACHIALIKKGGVYNFYSVGYEKYGIKEFIDNFTYSLDKIPLEREVVKKARPLLISDTHQDSRWIIFKETSWVRSYLIVPICLGNKVIGLLNLDSNTPGKFGEDDIKKLQPLANVAAIALENARLFEELQKEIAEHQQAEERLKKIMDAAIDTMSNIIEAKDPYTAGHQHRVCQLAVRIAQEMKLPEDKIEGISIASLIHDIGKISLPAEILSKPTKLTDIEFSLIKGHSQIGYDILKSIDFSYPIAKIVLQHHERLNSSGYPNNLKGDEVLLEARIIGVADVVEAMSSHRPYRPARGIDKALKEISQNKGILYDPEVVDICLKLFKEKGFKFE